MAYCKARRFDPCAVMAMQIFSGAFSQGYSTSCGQFFENPNLLPFFAQGPLVPDVKYRCLVSIYAHGETKLFVGFCDEASEMFWIPESKKSYRTCSQEGGLGPR